MPSFRPATVGATSSILPSFTNLGLVHTATFDSGILFMISSAKFSGLIQTITRFCTCEQQLVPIAEPGKRMEWLIQRSDYDRVSAFDPGMEVVD